MTYPEEMLASIAKVEASRPARMKQRFPSMTPEARDAVLHAFHPDYLENATRPIRIGVCAGDRTPKELAEVLEGPSYLSAEGFDLSRIDLSCDVLVVGGGGAGACAATDSGGGRGERPAGH